MRNEKRENKNDTLFSDREFLKFLPKVLRARDFRLYLEGGKRLVDLWLIGGRAVLGHKPPLVLRELKNAAERGLYSPLPHPAEERFLKALGEIFPGRTFRLYLDSGSLDKALAASGFTGTIPLWRPFLKADETQGPGTQGPDTPILRPVLPWSLGPEILVLDKSIDGSFPAGELIPPVLLAPATRALYNIIATMKAKGSGQRKYKKIEKVLTDSLWRRQGIYLWLKNDMDREKYKALFLHFLEGGFLIPPDAREPLILPISMSDGEVSKLAGLLR